MKLELFCLIIIINFFEIREAPEMRIPVVTRERVFSRHAKKNKATQKASAYA